jgi:putative FmdB family regulatory protein
MPTYEYACRKCGEHLEVVQSFNDQPLTSCPACGGDLRKVFGNIGIAFKGSGFYKNDSRPAPKSDSAKSDSGDTKTASGDTKADTKSGDTKSSESKSSDAKAKSSDTKSDKSEKSSPKAAAS